jgi:hypothetical protein
MRLFFALYLIRLELDWSMISMITLDRLLVVLSDNLLSDLIAAGSRSHNEERD